MGNHSKKTGPYPGLRPFNSDESRIFFGRESHCEQLLEKLAGNRMICVVGPSGCGKSSLVKAGLISDLVAGYMEAEYPEWEIATMRPGRWPLANLAGAFKTALGASAENRQSPFNAQYVFSDFMDEIERVGFPEDVNLLVLVDQFEEIFRFLEEIDYLDAKSFVSLILDLAAQEKYPIYVVLTMRSDFLGECALFHGLPEAINKGLFLTPRLDQEQLRDAILGPARVFGGEVEPSLVNRLIDEVGPDPDQLPLMQHALMRVYEQETSGLEVKKSEQAVLAGKQMSEFKFNLTLDAYNRIGGLKSALSNHANKTLDQAKAHIRNAQLLTQVLFRCLIKRDDGQRDLRNPVKISYVAEVAGADMATIEELIRFFESPGFVFTTRVHSHEREKQARLIDISHECLIRQWDKMKGEKSEKFEKSGWVKKEAKKAGIYALLAEEAEYWDEKGGQKIWDLHYWKCLAGSRTLSIANILRKEEMPNRAWAKKYDIALSNDKDSALKDLYLRVMANRGDLSLYRKYKIERKTWCNKRFDLTMKYLKFSRRYSVGKWPVLLATVLLILTGMGRWIDYSENRIKEHQLTANEFVEDNKFDRAENEYQKAIIVDTSPQLWLARKFFRYSPKVDLHNRLAQVYVGKSKQIHDSHPLEAQAIKDKAIDQCLAAITRDKNNILAMNTIAALRFERIISGQSQGQTDQWLEDVQRKYTDVYATDEKNVEALMGLVALNLYKENFDTAETYCRKAGEILKQNRFQKDMDLMRISKNMGDISLEKGRYKEALVFYRETYHYDPKNPCILNKIGSVHAKLGELTQAMESYRKAEALYGLSGMDKNKQDRVGTHSGMGAVLIKRCKYEKAREEFETALIVLSGPEKGSGMQMQKSIAYNGLGLAYLGEGYWNEDPDILDRALNAFSDALGHLPAHMKNSLFERLIYIGKGKALNVAGNHAGALASFQKACVTDKNDAEDVFGVFMKNNPGLPLDVENDFCN